MKRVLIPIYCPGFFGGFERRILRICESLSSSFHFKYMFYGCSELSLESALNLAGLTNVKGELVNVGSSVALLFRQLVIELCTFRPNVVWLYDYSRTSALIEVICSWTKVPVLVTVADFFLEKKLSNNQSLVRYLSKATCIDLLYPFQIDSFKSINKHISLTPGTFTDLNAFYPKQKRKQIVFISAVLSAQKNPGAVIEAVSKCQELLRSSGYSLVICGEGGQKERLVDDVAKQNLGDIVHFRGYCNPEDVLPVSSVLLAVQLGTNYPSQTIAEAAASGCYIIIYNNIGSKLMVNSSFSALIPCDSESLADAIGCYIKSSHNFKEGVCSSAREFAELNFNIELTSNYFRDLLNRISL